MELKNEGKSYREISLILEVSKSTISYWLLRIMLTNEQNRVLLENQRIGRVKGGQKRRIWRISKEKLILAKAAKEVPKISKKRVMVIGHKSILVRGS